MQRRYRTALALMTGLVVATISFASTPEPAPLVVSSPHATTTALIGPIGAGMRCGTVAALGTFLVARSDLTILGVIPMNNEPERRRSTDRARAAGGCFGPVRRRARARADRSHGLRLDVDGAGRRQRQRQEHVAQAARRSDLALARVGSGAPMVSVSRSSPSSTGTTAGCR